MASASLMEMLMSVDKIRDGKQMLGTDKQCQDLKHPAASSRNLGRKNDGIERKI